MENNTKLLKTLILLAIAIIVIAFTVIFPLLNDSLNTKDFSFVKSYSLQADPDSTYRDSLLNSFAYKSTKEKLDSIDAVTHVYSNPYWTGGISIARLFGTFSSNECDTCDYRKMPIADYPMAGPDKKYYITLSDYKPVETFGNRVHKPIFFKAKGKFYKKHLVLDSLLNKTDKGYFLTWKTEERSYGVDDLFTARNHKNILIPVSKKTFTIFQVLSYTIAILYFILSILFILRGFILFIFDLSKSKAFTKENYKRLFNMAYLLALYPVISFMLKLITHLIFKKHYSNDFDFYFDWSEALKLLFASLITLLIARAIKKGYEIKQEQDLTI
jgi:hypothetical protein